MKIDKEALQLAFRWNIQKYKHWYIDQFYLLKENVISLCSSMFQILLYVIRWCLFPIVFPFLIVAEVVMGYKELKYNFNDIRRERVKEHCQKSEGVVMGKLVSVFEKFSEK